MGQERARKEVGPGQRYLASLIVSVMSFMPRQFKLGIGILDEIQTSDKGI